MSDIEFDCPECLNHLVVDSEGAGMTAHCPQCSKVIKIPNPAVPSPPPTHQAQPEDAKGLSTCPDCGGKVSRLAPACPHCGRPTVLQKTDSRPAATQGLSKCQYCGQMIQPVVTSVGGGSCSVGSREKWTCPVCKRVIHTSGCLVATATYGDEDATEVRFLRLVRDRVLSRHLFGRAFTRTYYTLSPFVAWLVAHVPGAKRPARMCLDAIIASIEKRVSFSRQSVRALLARQAPRKE